MKLIERLRDFLFGSPQMSLLHYSLLAFAISILPGTILSGTGILVAEFLGYDSSILSGKSYPLDLANLLRTVVVAPVLETLMLALLMGFLSTMFKRELVVVTLSALLWGVLHGLLGPLRFFGTAWAFFVFSSAFLVWSRKSFSSGLLAAGIPHVLQNLAVMGFLIIESLV